ncbi:MAG: sulfite exporter TauE/SafE family protein [Candidatus Dormibacteria bacterium]
MHALPSLIVLGFAVGAVIGATGVGAGAVLTPVLVLLGVRPAVAVGTALVFSLLTKPVGAAQHLSQGSADLRVVGWLAAGSLPAAAASLLLVRTALPSRILLDRFTQHAIAGALLVVAVLMTLRLGNRLPRRTRPPRAAVLAATGAAVGAMVSLTSVGSGSIAIAALSVLTPLAVSALIGTDMVHAALLAAVTAPFYLAGGSVDLGLALALGLGSIPGVVAGSRLSVTLPERVTRGTLVAALWLVALTSL